MSARAGRSTTGTRLWRTSDPAVWCCDTWPPESRADRHRALGTGIGRGRTALSGKHLVGRPFTSWKRTGGSRSGLQQHALAPDVAADAQPGRRAVHAVDAALAPLVDQEDQFAPGADVE